MRKRPENSAFGRIALALAGLICLSAVLEAQTDTGPNVVLLTPGDPSWTQTLQSNFPGLTNSASFGAMERFLAVIVNRDAFPVKGYAIRWTVSYKDFAPQTMDYFFIHRPIALISFIDGPLAPGQMRLVTPTTEVSPFEFRQLPEFQSGVLAGMTPQATSNITGISVGLDAVVLEDGSFSGPNATGFKTRYACFARAETDLGNSAASASAADLPVNLQQLIKSGIGRDASGDAASLYAYYLYQNAQDLRNYLNSQGFSAALTRAQQLIGADAWRPADCSL